MSYANTPQNGIAEGEVKQVDSATMTKVCFSSRMNAAEHLGVLPHSPDGIFAHLGLVWFSS